MRKMTFLMLMLLVLAASTAVLAQEAASALTGTITLRSGQTLSGLIKQADLGIMDGAGIGTNLSGNGAIKVMVNGQAQRLAAADIATVEVTWQDKSTPEEPSWKITELKVTTRDGKVVAGEPGWYMHATSVSVQLASGETKRVHAFPLAGPDFSPDNLIAKIELGEVAAVPTGPTPVEPTEPVTTEPAAPVEPTEPVTTEPTTPTEPAAPVTPVVEPTPTIPAPTTPTPTVTPTVIGAPQPIVVTVAIPGTDKKVTIIIYVTVVDGEVKVVPAAP